MALPSTGVEYDEYLEPNLNDAAVRKGIVTDILVRDYNYASTDLSAVEVGLNDNGHFSPFAADGRLRDDLVIGSNGGDNLGLYHMGLLHEDGINYEPNVNTERVNAAQTRRPVRVDITEETDSLKITALESTPLIDALRFDLPLLGLQDVGAVGYSLAKPANGNIVERQIIALMFDGKQRSAYILPRASRANVGASDWNKSNPDRLELTYEGLNCPFTNYPVLLLREGEGWRGMGGYPVFVGTPTATPTTAGHATVAHPIPSSTANLAGSDNAWAWEYEVEKAVSPFTSWSAATIDSSAIVGGNITHTVSAVTAGSTKFRVKATGANGLTANSDPSATVTIT